MKSRIKICHFNRRIPYCMEKKIEKLKGKDLTSYVDRHKKEFQGNGDELCLAAGYGVQTDDGNEKCDFSDFVKALSLAEGNSDKEIEES